MNLIADSKDFSSDQRKSGLALLLCFSIPLMFAPLYLLVAPSSLGIPFPAALAVLLGGLALMLFIGLALKSRGMLFKVPLRVFDGGLLIQPAVGLKPVMVPYPDISAVELFYGSEEKIKSGCSVSTFSRGRIRSIENFSGKDSMQSFAGKIRPALEQSGFRLDDSQEGERSARYLFRKPVVLPAVAASASAPWRI
ncbi:hypothetical protein L0Y65_04100 [Candidatus Micrarchaeota archaeon]|nr:hypothetical protein [Candidatus Micrarchaeota archaeon]